MSLFVINKLQCEYESLRDLWVSVTSSEYEEQFYYIWLNWCNSINTFVEFVFFFEGKELLIELVLFFNFYVFRCFSVESSRQTYTFLGLLLKWLFLKKVNHLYIEVKFLSSKFLFFFLILIVLNRICKIF